MDLKEKTDEELISQILDTKSTDRRLCQEELYDRYINKIYGKCLLLCKDPEAAKDVTQDVFIIVFTKLNTFRADSPFFGWIYKILTNVFLCVEYQLIITSRSSLVNPNLSICF
ncbi:RNA polymerase sigma factor [Lacihabitans lacunae]|uniref:RNA polymerase sigma factor n=1 Tax=Lacihabitans lacunae TaxID=1028214 RepID=A0ABV7Z0D3_9BACT